MRCPHCDDHFNVNEVKALPNDELFVSTSTNCPCCGKPITVEYCLETRAVYVPLYIRKQP